MRLPVNIITVEGKPHPSSPSICDLFLPTLGEKKNISKSKDTIKKNAIFFFLPRPECLSYCMIKGGLWGLF